VASGNEAEALDVVAAAVKGLASHPGGAEGVTSIVAVLDLQFQHLVLGQRAPPRGFLGRWYSSRWKGVKFGG
jgi:hypothetical protein